jgi:hypothetical protein
LTLVVTEKEMVREYFCCMYPSVQFLLGNDVPTSEGATIHSIVPQPELIDDDKIGFTLDVAMRLDREQSDQNAEPGVVVPMVENPPPELADSA